MTNEHHFVDEDPRMAHIHVEDDYRMQSMGIMAVSALWVGLHIQFPGCEVDIITEGMWILRDGVGNPIKTYYLEIQ